jgi:carboxymethylenebutenolidase
MYDGMMAESVHITGDGGDEIAAYLARPLGPGPYPGVVVIHHMPGWDEGTKEITRRFATRGYVAICPHLHYRDFINQSAGPGARVAVELSPESARELVARIQSVLVAAEEFAPLVTSPRRE